MIEIIEMVEKHSTLITINCGTYFYFGIFHSKSIIMLVLCLVLEKKAFCQFLLIVPKMNDTVSFEDKFFVNIYSLLNQKFLFKVCNADSIMRGFDIKLFSTIFTQ